MNTEQNTLQDLVLSVMKSLTLSQQNQDNMIGHIVSTVSLNGWGIFSDHFRVCSCCSRWLCPVSVQTPQGAMYSKLLQSKTTHNLMIQQSKLTVTSHETHVTATVHLHNKQLLSSGVSSLYPHKKATVKWLKMLMHLCEQCHLAMEEVSINTPITGHSVCVKLN